MSKGKGLYKVLNYELKDDDTPTGGTAFAGETVRDFIESIDDNISNLGSLNKALTECGIKPVCVS